MYLAKILKGSDHQNSDHQNSDHRPPMENRVGVCETTESMNRVLFMLQYMRAQLRRDTYKVIVAAQALINMSKVQSPSDDEMMQIMHEYLRDGSV